MLKTNLILMNYIRLFLFLLLSHFASAQDSRLFDTTWYLTKLVDNEVETYPPGNTEVVNVPLVFNQANVSISTNVCNGMEGGVVFENNLTHFVSSDNLYTTLIICNQSENGDFESLYFSFFTLNTDFSYSIVESGNSKTLSIVNLNNNKTAFYSSQTLSNTKFKELDFGVYSNSKTEMVVVELKNPNVTNTKVEIVDASGKIYRSQNFNSSSISIDVKGLSAGMYIVKVTNADGVGVRKIIK